MRTSNRLNDEGRACSSNQTLHPRDVLAERELIFIHVGGLGESGGRVTHHRLPYASRNICRSHQRRAGLAQCVKVNESLACNLVGDTRKLQVACLITCAVA